jgi:hypothetical protein
MWLYFIVCVSGFVVERPFAILVKVEQPSNCL